MTLGMTLPLVGAATAALKFSTDFETAMVKVGNLTNIGASGIKEMRAEILKLSPQVAVGPKELAAGLLTIASTGLKGADALNVLTQSAKATAVGLGETRDVGRAVTAAIKAYGSETLTAEAATNKLFVAVREGGAETNEMASQLGRVVGIAKQMGVSFDEVLASIATFTRLGVDAATATTGLRATIIAMLHPSAQAVETLQGMGTSIDEVRKSIREKGLAVALQDLLKLADGDADAIGRIIPEARALASVLGTAGALGKDYNEVLRTIQTSSGDLDAAFTETSKTLGFRWNAALAQAQIVLLKFGDAIAPVFGKLLEMADPVLRILSRMAEVFDALPGPVKAAAVAVGIFLAALGPGVWILGSWIQMAGFAATALAALTKFLGGASVAATVNAAATTVANAAQVNHIKTIVIDIAAKAAATKATYAYATSQLALAGATGAAAKTLQSTSLVLLGAGGAMQKTGGIIDGVIVETAAAASEAAPAIGLLTRAFNLLIGPIGRFTGFAGAVITAAGAWGEVGRILKAVSEIIKNAVISAFDAFVNDMSRMASAVATYGGPIIDWLDRFLGVSRDLAAIKKGLGDAAKGLETLAGATAKPVDVKNLERAKKVMDDMMASRGPKPIDAEDVMSPGLKLDDLSNSARSFTAQLSEAREALSKLTKEQRAEIAAGNEMGKTVDEITRGLNSQWPELKLTAASVSLYKEQLTDAERVHDKFAAAMDRVRKAAIPLTEAQKRAVIGFENLGLSADEMAPAVGASAERISMYQGELKNLASMQEWVTEKQRDFVAAMNNRALNQGNKENIEALKALTAARNESVDALLTGTDKEVRAIERRLQAEIDAINAEEQKIAGNKEERIRLRQEAATREIALVRGMYGQIEELANAFGVKTKMQQADEWAKAKMFLDFMLDNRKLFNERLIKEQEDLVKKLLGEWKKEGAGFKEIFSRIAGGVRELAAAWSQLAQTTEEGSPERAFAQAANAASIIVSDVEGILKAKNAIEQVIAAIKLAVDAAALLWDALSVSNGEDVARRIGKGWGIKIGEELGNAIWETAKKTFGGDKFAAELAHMQDIIAAGASGAGVSKEVFIKANFDALMGQLRNVFALVEMGTLNVAQAGKILDDNFADLLEAGTSAYGLVNQKIIEAIKLTQRLGIESKAVTKFLQDQSKSVSEGLNLIAGGTIGEFNRANDTVRDAGDQLVEAREKVERLQASIADLKKKGITTEKQRAQMKLWIRQLADAQTEVSMLEQKIKGAEGTIKEAGATGQAAFDRLGRLAVVAFAAGIGSGKSFLQMMEEIGPALDEAARAQQTFGFEATGAFKDLVDIRNFIKNNKELVGTLDGVNKMMVGLKNSSMLTQDTFNDLTGIAKDTFDKMVKGGLSSNQALILMQPTLQTIWELQHDFGFEVDAATQALIDQGIEAGVVGEQHRSAADKMVIALDKVVGVLELIAIALGVTLPKAAETGAGKVNDSLGKIRVPPIDFPRDFPTDYPEINVPTGLPPGSKTVAQFGGMMTPEGIQHFINGGTALAAGRDTVPALLAPGETIRTPQQETVLQRELTDGGGTTVVKIYLKESEIASVMVDGLSQDGKALAKITRLIKQVKVSR